MSLVPYGLDAKPALAADVAPASGADCFCLCFPFPLPCVLMTWMVRCYTCACKFKFSTFLFVANDCGRVCCVSIVFWLSLSAACRWTLSLAPFDFCFFLLLLVLFEMNDFEPLPLPPELFAYFEEERILLGGLESFSTCSRFPLFPYV